MTDERREKIINAVATAFREIGQPDIKGLVFVCEEGSRFEGFDTIIGIPVYVVPFLNVRGGLLLASKSNYNWNDIGLKCSQFQQELEELLPEED